MEAEAPTIELGVQLLAAGGMMFLMTLTHGLGLIGIASLFKLQKTRLVEHDLNARAMMLMCGITLSIFALHTAEIGIFAGFYLAVGAMQSVEEALYYSASAYGTLGRTADYFPDEWRLVGAFEALIGFVLIGWSTAFIVRNVDQLRTKDD